MSTSASGLIPASFSRFTSSLSNSESRQAFPRLRQSAHNSGLSNSQLDYRWDNTVHTSNINQWQFRPYCRLTISCANTLAAARKVKRFPNGQLSKMLIILTDVGWRSLWNKFMHTMAIIGHTSFNLKKQHNRMGSESFSYVVLGAPENSIKGPLDWVLSQTVYVAILQKPFDSAMALVKQCQLPDWK